MDLGIDCARQNERGAKILALPGLRRRPAADPFDNSATNGDITSSITRSVRTTRPVTTRSKSLMSDPYQ